MFVVQQCEGCTNVAACIQKSSGQPKGVVRGRPLVLLVAGAARLATMDMPKAKTPEERTTKKYKTPDDFLGEV